MARCVGILPKDIRDALAKAARSGKTPEHRVHLFDEIMAKAKRNYPHLFKAD